MAILLALLSAASWGSGDFIGGLAARRMHALVVLFASQLTGLAFALLLVVVLGETWPGLAQMWMAFVAGAAGAVALACFYRALAIGTMSVVAPISSTAVIVPVVVGVAGGDRPSALQLAGIVVAISGIVLASREAADEASGDAPAGDRAAIGLALVAALGFGVFLAAIAGAADESVPWALVCARGISVTIVLGALVTVLPRGERAPARGAVPRLAVVGIFDTGANVLYGYATTKGLLSVVSVLGSLYPVTTVVLAWFVLRERLVRVQQVGVACAFCGVAFIAAG